MGTATRVYRTFKVLGHDEVPVLDGGMNAYLAEVDGNNKPVNPLDKGAVEVAPTAFTIDVHEEMVPDAEEVMAMIESGVLAVDNRPADQ